MKRIRIVSPILSLLVLLMLLSACGAKPTEIVPTETLPATATAFLVADTPTAPPTPVAAIPAEVVLWTSAGADPNLTAALTQQLQDYVNTNNLRLEVRQQLSAPELAQPVRLVVALAPAVEISALASAVPAVSFLGIGAPDLAVGANVHSLTQANAALEDRAFLAGFLLGLVIPDYRVGVIAQAGTDDGVRTIESFAVGAQYFCGLCNSKYGPVLYYPISATIGDPANPADWQMAADILLANSVTGVFIQPEVSSPELVAYLETAGVKLLGTPAQSGLSNGPAWLGVLGSDLTGGLVSAVDRLLAGESLGSVSTGLELTQVNRDLVSEGKQLLFERIVRELQSGLIRTSPFR